MCQARERPREAEAILCKARATDSPRVGGGHRIRMEFIVSENVRNYLASKEDEVAVVGSGERGSRSRKKKEALGNSKKKRVGIALTLLCSLERAGSEGRQ